MHKINKRSNDELNAEADRREELFTSNKYLTATPTPKITEKK